MDVISKEVNSKDNNIHTKYIYFFTGNMAKHIQGTIINIEI